MAKLEWVWTYNNRKQQFWWYSVVLEGTSVRDKVNNLWCSFKSQDIFSWKKKHWKTKRSENSLNIQLTLCRSLCMQTLLPTLSLGSHPAGCVLSLALGVTVDRQVFILVWEFGSVFSKWANHSRHLTLICCLIAYFNTLNCEVNLIM